MQDTLAERYGGDNFKCSPTGHITNIYVPMVVEGVASLCDARCGWSHTVVITCEFHLIAFFFRIEIENWPQSCTLLLDVEHLF